MIFKAFVYSLIVCYEMITLTYALINKDLLLSMIEKSCSGEQERISGHVSLRFSFEGDNGNKVMFVS